MSLPIIYAVALTLVTVCAYLLGGRTSRIATTMYLAAQLFSMLCAGNAYHRFESGLMLSDLVLLGGLIWLILRTTQTWPVACGTLQLLTVLGHLARLVEPRTPRLAYAIMVQWTAWPALLVLIAGIWLDRRAGRT